jgi:Zn-dependent M16 (insulinase) family peptidase
MSPKQKLDDLIALREALRSQRRWLTHAKNDHGWRIARVRAAIHTIRACRATILAAIAEIAGLRDTKSMDEQAARIDARIEDLSKKIVMLDKTSQAARVAEKIRKMQERMREMNASLPLEFQLEDIL